MVRDVECAGATGAIHRSICKILAPRFRKCCDVKTMLPGKFAQAVMKVPDVAKADADVSEMC